MRQLLSVVTPLHKRTTRDYLARMIDDKVHCMRKARNTSSTTGTAIRRYGYGGYRYDGRWKVVAQQLIDHYQLGPNARILDVGCGKAHLLHELKQLLPGADVTGFDVSQHGLADAPEPIRPYLFRYRAQDPYPWGDKHFDLVISFGALHNLRVFELEAAVRDRARRPAEIHHGRELPERARAVQPRMLGADRGILLRHGRMDLAVPAFRVHRRLRVHLLRVIAG
jgi:SAM-dependent methyltransferase